MPLKNIILACLESSLSRIAVKKIFSSCFCLILKILGFKNAISFKILKINAFIPFSAVYYVLIDFSEIYNLLFHTANQVYLRYVEIESMELSTEVRLSRSFNFSPEIPQINQIKHHNSLRKKRLDLQIFRIFSSQ